VRGVAERPAQWVGLENKHSSKQASIDLRRICALFLLLLLLLKAELYAALLA